MLAHDHNMNPSPKRLGKLVGFGRKMEPLISGTVLDVLNVWNREYWFILRHEKKSSFFSNLEIFFSSRFKIQIAILQRNSVYTTGGIKIPPPLRSEPTKS